ncbi:hypothetical protein SRHO_G00227240 [Serrasalmus rhombeus]
MINVPVVMTTRKHLITCTFRSRLQRVRAVQPQRLAGVLWGAELWIQPASLSSSAHSLHGWKVRRSVRRKRGFAQTNSTGYTVQVTAPRSGTGSLTRFISTH